MTISLEDLDRRVMWHPFTQMAEWNPLVIERGEGCYLIDSKNRRYLDGVSSLWCNVHGHNHPRLNRALREQLDRIAHSTFLGLTHEPGIRLGEALVEVAPRGLTRVFYSDSGSTAVEIALKQSFQYWQLRGRSKKQRFLRLDNAYHGDTLGAVGVGGIDLFQRIFGPLLVQSIAISSPAGTDGSTSIELLETTLKQQANEIAAFVLEPLIQGAAGMLLHPMGFLRRVAEVCRAHDVHLIADEVATGFGRTGTLFACEQEQVTPDFLCIAKGMAGGYLPLAATLSTEEIYSAFLGTRSELKQFFHGHTFTANPLACAVGLESLALLREETLENVQARISTVQPRLERLRGLAGIQSVRQCGLMVGIELTPRGTRLLGAETCELVRSKGVILRPLGNVVVWMPPLIVTDQDLTLLEEATTESILEVTSLS